MHVRLYLSPKGTNQVERNPALHLLLKQYAFCLNYRNLTIFPLPKPSLLPPHQHAVSHTHEAAPENLRAVFETGAPQVRLARVSQDKKSIYYSQTSNKNTLQATVQTVKRDRVTRSLFVPFPHTGSQAEETQESPH